MYLIFAGPGNKRAAAFEPTSAQWGVRDADLSLCRRRIRLARISRHLAPNVV